MLEDNGRYSTATAFKTRNYLSLAALVVAVLDYGLTLKFEYTHIWTSPFRTVKLLYVCARYLSLATLAVHNTLIHTHLENAPVSTISCQVWIFSMLASAMTLLLILDTVLLLRVYALHQRHKGIFWLLIPIAAQPLAVAITSKRSLFKEGSLNEICDYKGSMVDGIGISVTILIAHSLLCIGTFMKRNIAQGHAAVVKMVVTESVLALALIFAALCAIVPYTSISQRVCPFYTIPWLVTAIPVMCCRLVMNMRRLQVEASLQDNVVDLYMLSTVVLLSPEIISDLECAPPPDKGSKCLNNEII